MDDGSPIHGHTGLEIVWTLIPTVLVTGIAIYSRRRSRPVGRRPADHRVVEVHGEQFAWTFTYPDIEVEGGKPLTTGELVLPINQTVQFDITSKDVIHSFWVPEWRMKQDAVQGITTHDDREADAARDVPGHLHGALRARPRDHAFAGGRPLPGRLRGLGRTSRSALAARAGPVQGKELFTQQCGELSHARRRRARRARSARTSTTCRKARTQTSSGSRSSIRTPRSHGLPGRRDAGELRGDVHRRRSSTGSSSTCSKPPEEGPASGRRRPRDARGRARRVPGHRRRGAGSAA